MTTDTDFTPEPPVLSTTVARNVIESVVRTSNPAGLVLLTVGAVLSVVPLPGLAIGVGFEVVAGSAVSSGSRTCAAP
jgi:hypothetical protein